MDVSIAVSLIRGQMGTVVERAVNVAVETVLAEMLKVVGVKFEELKAQVATLKRDMAALQREKALKEKENDKTRALLRYTELKLKYYRQGVEEEMQQRSSASSSASSCSASSTAPQARSLQGPVAPPPATRGSLLPSPLQATPTPGSQPSSSPGSGCVQHRARPMVRVSSQPATASGPTAVPLSQALSHDSRPGVALTITTAEDLQPLSEGAPCFSDEGKDEEQRGDWSVSLQPDTETLSQGPPPPLCGVGAPLSGPPPRSPDRSAQADSSTLSSGTPQLQVKEEACEEEEYEEEEVICIKEEPEEVLVLPAPSPSSEGQRSQVDWSGHSAGQRSFHDHMTLLSSSASVSYVATQPLGTVSSVTRVQAPSAGVPPRQAVRPWPKELSLYEEYKLRRSDLRQRGLARRRDLEKTLPQPLLAELVRERREKTRLRVARWRAKRKLQACLDQAQAPGGTAGVSQQHGFPINAQQQQQHRSFSASSSGQQRAMSSGTTFYSNSVLSNFSSSLPFISLPPPSSSSSLLLGTHTVSSSSSQPLLSLSQPGISLRDTDLFQ